MGRVQTTIRKLITWAQVRSGTRSGIFHYKRTDVSYQGGLATAFDLAAFRLSMIAPVKKSVNYSRTVASMRETGLKQKQ